LRITKVIKAAQIILIGLTAFWVVRAIMVYVTPQSAWMPLPNTSSLQSNAGAPIGQTGEAAIDTSFDPFHRSAAAASAALGEDAPETTLDLTLVGRRAGVNGTAILRLPTGKQKAFRIEDEILSGVTLEAVNVDFIVIAQDGRLERLTFERDERGLQVTPESVPQDTVAQKAGVANVNEGAITNKKSPYLNSNGVIAAQNVTSVVNQNSSTQTAVNQTASPSSNPLLAALNFTPQRVNNQVTGYKITPKQRGFNTAVFGLQPGDVVTRIGATDLQNENVDFAALLSQVQAGGATTIELIRNGQAVSVNVRTP